MDYLARIPIPMGMRPVAITVPVPEGTYSVCLDWSADAPQIAAADFLPLNGGAFTTVHPCGLALVLDPNPPPYRQGKHAGGLWISYLRS